ncbi:TIGR02301 family protein [Methylovirgula sp. 4M-Z18]|uniref:TIGR02301 family protein n=1 Tax=Methylovirgula sp. 4M-Z18 TaxID=2293567 RepID=UPI001FE06248|nr:TIGR02301 family protein [Methylovirgula sp. 4M-Z18]
MASASAFPQSKSAPKPPPPPPPPQEEAPPPYEPQLLRLSELMGSLSYLGDLCGRKDGTDWRNRMSDLIAKEARSDLRKQRLAGAYNRGYRDLEIIYHSCTPAAQLLMARYLDEGEKLVQELTSKFSG